MKWNKNNQDDGNDFQESDFRKERRKQRFKNKRRDKKRFEESEELPKLDVIHDQGNEDDYYDED